MNLTADTALHNGKYVLETQLGKGIFGITYRATNTESSETVVIKTLAETLHQHSDFDEFKQKFLELAKRLSRCQHPNLVQVLDYFEDAGCPYLVMEYVPGQTLAQFVQSQVLSESKAIEYVRQIGDALSVLHQAGLLHLNVKPENIIRRQDNDSLVLCEFGITCQFTPEVMQTHASLVSAGYAALELYFCKAKRSPATDIYALAATFYHLLAGHPPLPTPVRKALLSKESGSAATPQEHRPLLPDKPSSPRKVSLAAKQALRYGLQMAASKRPQTVEAWLDLLKSQEKNSVPQPTIAQHSVVQLGTDTEVPSLENSVHRVKSRGLADGEQKLNPNSQPSSPQSRKAPSLPKVANDLTAASTKRKTPGSSKQKKSTPQIGLAQPLVTELETQNGHSSPAPKKLKAPKIKSLLQALLMTGAIAGSAGVGFGFALRMNGSTAPGSTLLHTNQSFPPTSKWPTSEPQVEPQL
ncbi:MAG TPA: serine/threonine-protein kinase [Coleofasciculaceae cyanobacterium]|jgi:serine/threonine-protein kinase